MVEEQLDFTGAFEFLTVGATAIAYSPESCSFGVFDGSTLVDQTGKPLDLSRVYEARIFDANREVRLLLGRKMAVISDELFAGCRKLERTYLLWGEPSGAPRNGWTRFAEARIGEFFMPVTATGHGCLTAVEYVAVDTETGNSYIADERLSGLREVK